MVRYYLNATRLISVIESNGKFCFVEVFLPKSYEVFLRLHIHVTYPFTLAIVHIIRGHVSDKELCYWIGGKCIFVG